MSLKLLSGKTRKPSRSSRESRPLRYPPLSRSHHPQGLTGTRSGAFGRLHDEVERRHRGPVLVAHLLGIHDLRAAHHSAHFRNLQRGPLRGDRDRCASISLLLGSLQDLSRL